MNSPATVQRYEMVDHGSYYEAMRMDPKPDGEWVMWEDHCRALEGLQKEVAELRATAREALEEAKTYLCRCGTCRLSDGTRRKVNVALALLTNHDSDATGACYE